MSEKAKKDRPKVEAEVRQKVEAEVRQKVDCEEKAFRWVEHLALVDNISENEFAKMISEIMINHYTDIIEERACSKVCGYPLCSEKLAKRSSQKYRISTKHNKVIDLSVRENFCSLYCYQASKFIENQIPQDPLWLRSGKPIDVQLLEKKSSKTVDIGEVPLELANLNINDEKENRNDDSSEDDETYSYGLEEKPCHFKTCVSDEESKNIIHDINQKQEKTKSPKQTKLIDSKDVARNKNTGTQNYITKIIGLLKEWLTKKSYQYINFFSNEYYDSDDEPDNTDIKDAQLFPETAEFQAKVLNFLSRQPEWASESIMNGPDNEEKEDKKSRFSLPTIDSRSQNSIRRRIVHEKLNSSLREVLPICGLLEEDLTEVGFFKLVDTFNFTSRNIVLNVKEWLVITLVLLRMISKKYQKDFGTIMKRHQDINEFLIMRALPNISQVDEIIDIILKHGETDREIMAEKTPNNVDYYYDNMEEVD